MKPEELRSVQTPLKERYREAPDAAFITLRAQARNSLNSLHHAPPTVVADPRK